MSNIKIAVGGLEHETAGFLDGNTKLDEFLESKISKNELIQRVGTSNTVVDGYISGVKKYGWELIPMPWFKAQSGAPASFETLNVLVKEFTNELKLNSSLNGVLMSLHGAFSVEGVDDADGYVLEEIRKIVGINCPIMVVHDLHCNISQKTIDAADIISVMRTYPHIDMRERALEIVDLLSEIIKGNLKPKLAFRQIPILWSAPKMIDAEYPMKDVIKKLEHIDKQKNVVSSSLGVGYQWIDSPDVGASAIVVTNDDEESANKHVDDISNWIWEKRDQFVSNPLKPEKAIKNGIEAGKYPIILADQADNTGGGAPGDSTEILKTFIDLKLESAAILYMVDPESAAEAHRIGEGGKLKTKIGGKSNNACGPPIDVDAEILKLSDGKFVYDGPMWKGVNANLGLSTLIRMGSIFIIIISKKQQPIDLAFSRKLGLDCSKLKFLGIKSTGHFRSGFESIAGSIYNVDASGIFTQDFNSLPYTRLRDNMYPL